MGVQEDAGPSTQARGRRTSGGTTSPRRRHGGRRTRWWIAGGVAAVLVALLAWAALDLRLAYAELRAAEAAGTRARSALMDGGVDPAREAFAEAEASFSDATRVLARPMPRLLAAVPLAGRSLTVTGALADAGREVAVAGRVVTAAIAGLPGGPEALAPRDGRLPIEHIAALAPAMEQAESHVDRAERRVLRSPTSFLVGPVGRARTDFLRQLSEVREPVRAAAALASALPSFLGSQGPRRYFFGAQNPAELRGTGGLIGAWTVVTVDQGRLEFGDFATIGTLTASDPQEVEAPSPDFAARYGRFAAAGHGSNINMTPDFPTAAAAIVNLHEREHGERLHGAIVADPYVFEAVLRLTGPVDVPDVRRLDADTVVDFVTNEQWAEFGEDVERKPVLGSVAEVALMRFLVDGGDDPATSLRVLARTAGDGHLLLYSTNPDEQAAFTAAGVAGAFADDTDGAFLAVTANNAGANKLDYYLEQELEYEVWLAEDGSAFGHLTWRLANTAPTSGRDQTVLGPNVDFLQAGENLVYLSTYCHPQCSLLRHTRDEDPQPVGAEREFGMAVFPTTVRLASGESTELRYEWRQQQVWDSRGFRLVVPGQATMRPVMLRLRVHAPPDLPLSARRTRGAHREGSVVFWEGELGRRTVIDLPRQGGLRDGADGLLDRLDAPVLGDR